MGTSIQCIFRCLHVSVPQKNLRTYSVQSYNTNCCLFICLWKCLPVWWSWEDIWNNTLIVVEGVVLQQVWTTFLKDRLSSTPSANRGNGGSGDQNGDHRSGVLRCLCFAFNQGECNYGVKCKFEHRCRFCGKFGHGTVNCRKALNNNPKNVGGKNQGQRGPGGSGLSGPLAQAHKINGEKS